MLSSSHSPNSELAHSVGQEVYVDNYKVMTRWSLADKVALTGF